MVEDVKRKWNGKGGWGMGDGGGGWGEGGGRAKTLWDRGHGALPTLTKSINTFLTERMLLS